MLVYVRYIGFRAELRKAFANPGKRGKRLPIEVDTPSSLAKISYVSTGKKGKWRFRRGRLTHHDQSETVERLNRKRAEEILRDHNLL